MRGKQRTCDDVDLWCIDWARQRRIALGIIEAKMIEPNERVGQLRCTLSKVKTERDGASYSRSNQNFPEVYVGMPLVIHQAYSSMPGDHRLVMHLHYVWREIPYNEKFKEASIKAAQYWTLLGKVKSFLIGYVASGASNYAVSTPKVTRSEAHAAFS